MNNAIATQNKGDVMESVLISGDLSKLTPEQRTQYYLKVCDSVGLNPITKPFEYIVLNNKLTLYAMRACTDQLRSINKISVVEMTETEREGVIIVTAKVCNADGRTDVSKGAVNISGLKGDNLANAIMKAETKAKRRATLSICGLGLLDETEIETIPNATVPEFDKQPSEKSIFKKQLERTQFHSAIINSLNTAENIRELNEAMLGIEERLKQIDEQGSLLDKDTALDVRNRYKSLVANFKALNSQMAQGDDFYPTEDPIDEPATLAEAVTILEQKPESFTSATGKPMFKRA